MTPDTLKTYVSYQCSQFKTHKSDTKDKFSNTRFIEWYHNKNSSGLYLLTYNLFPFVFLNPFFEAKNFFKIILTMIVKNFKKNVLLALNNLKEKINKFMIAENIFKV